MEEDHESLERDVEDLHGYIIQISAWLPRFLGHLSRFESLPNPIEFPRVVASIGREFKVIVADMKTKVQLMREVETLKHRLQPQLEEAGDYGLGNLAVNLQLLELEWRRTCVLVRNIHDKIVVAVKRACAQTFLDEANKKKVHLGELYIIEEEEEEPEQEVQEDRKVEEALRLEDVPASKESTLSRRRKFHLLVDSKQSVDAQLAKISYQLFECSAEVTSMETCQLSSVALELRVGEVQALKTILEVHHSEITFMLETLGSEGAANNEMVVFTLNDLWDKCGVLIKNFEDMEELYREVCQLVSDFEEGLQRSRQILGGLFELGSRQLEWLEFEQAFEQLEDHQAVLSGLSDLSCQLLTLEPTFEGECVRGSMHSLADHYNGTKERLKGHLSAQIEERRESLQCDLALVASWVEQALLMLSYQCRRTTAAKGTQLLQELGVYEEMLGQVKHSVVGMCSAASRACVPTISHLAAAVEEVEGRLTTVSLAYSATAARRDSTGGEGREDEFINRPLSGHFSVHFGDLDTAIQQLTQEVQEPPYAAAMETTANGPEVSWEEREVGLTGELKATQDGLQREIAAVTAAVDSVDLPPSLDMEKVQSGVEACRMYQQMLDTLQQKVAQLSLESRQWGGVGGGVSPGERGLGLLTFDLVASLQRANVHLTDRLNCLRSMEVEIGRFTRQVGDLANLVSTAQDAVQNPTLDIQVFLIDCARVKEKMAAASLSRSDVLDKLSVLNGKTVPEASEMSHYRTALEGQWDQVCRSLDRVGENEAEVEQRFVRTWTEWVDAARKELDGLRPSGYTLSKIAAKHSLAQALSLDSRTISRCLESLESTGEVQQLLAAVQEVGGSAAARECDLSLHLAKLKDYVEEYGELKSWLADMTMLVQGEQHRVKRRTICQQLMAKEKSLRRLQEMTRDMKELEASSTERTRLLVRANDLFDCWDRLCQQCVPAGVMKLGVKREQAHREEFSSPSDMLKWLMEITSRLQSQPQANNSSSQLQIEEALASLKSAQEEMGGLKTNFERLVSSSSEDSEATWVANQQKRLKSTWQEVRDSVAERLQSLETVHTLWTEFDIKKERILEFVRTAAKRLDQPLFITASSSLRAVDEGLSKHQEFCHSVVAMETDVLDLTALSTKLLHYHHGNSQNGGLTEVMLSLNESYAKIKNRSEQSIKRLAEFGDKWILFFKAYKKLQNCATHLQVRASELKAPPNTMATITKQKEIITAITGEEESRQEVIDSAHSSLYQLLEPSIPCPLDRDSLKEKVEGLCRKIGTALLLTRTKQGVLEGALLERQQVVDQLAAQTAWLGQAQGLVQQLRPLGRDLAQVELQFHLLTGFWVEYEEQVEKMDQVLAASAHLVSIPSQSREEARLVELVEQQHSRLGQMWAGLREEAEHAKDLLERIYPELMHLHTSCTQIARLLTSAEMKLTSAQPIPQTLPQLRILAAEHEEVEAILEPLEQLLENLQLSKKNLVKMGFSPSTDLTNLMSRFDRRWVEVSRYGHSRGVRLNEVLAKFGSSSIPIRDGTLPRGWSKIKRDNCSPLYTMTTDGSSFSQRQHPELTQFFEALQSKYSHVRFGRYRTALKLRDLQKRLHLNLINSKNAMMILLRHFDVTTETVTIGNLVEVLSALYYQIEKDFGERVKAGRCVDMATSWILETFDRKNAGNLKTVSVKTAILLLCGGKLSDKLKCVFQVFVDSRGEIEDQVLLQVFKDALKVPHTVGEESLFPSKMGPAAADIIFNNCTHVVKLEKWLSWLQSEPAILSWVPLMHRLSQSERSEHDSKCSICKMDPIMGFRYRCLECFRVDLCQDCFWSGRATRHHQPSHSVQEYCQSSTLSESVKDFFKVIGNKIKRSSPGDQTPPPTPTRSPALGAKRGRYHISSTSSIGSSGSLSDVSVFGGQGEEDLDSLILQLEEQNRDISTQLEHLQLDAGLPPPAPLASQLLSIQAHRQALQGRISFLQTQNDKLLSQISRLRTVAHQRSDLEVVEV